MAVLSNADRLAIDKLAERQLPKATGTGFAGLSRADLQLAINAIDDWVDSNSTAFNTAIPQPARGSLTSKQKAQLLVYVVERRAELA